MGSYAVLFVLFVASIVVPTITTPSEITKESIYDIVQFMTLKFSGIEPENYWHPYVDGTGNENRESIHVQGFELKTFEGSYLQWRHAKLGMKDYLVGMRSRSIALFSLDFEQIASIDTNDTLVALEVFTRWNNKYNHVELKILAATDKNRLHVYQLKDNEISSLGAFPFEYNVKEIQVSHVGATTKVILIPKNPGNFIDIYNLESDKDKVHVWFLQRLSSVHFPNQVVVHDLDIPESVIAVATFNNLVFFALEEGIYKEFQTQHRICQKLFSFSVAYGHTVGCVTPYINETMVPTLQLIRFDHNSNLYITVPTSKAIEALDMFPVAAADYREDYLLLSIGLDHTLAIYFDSGKENGDFQLVKPCGSQESDKCPDVKNINLKHGDGFQLGEYTAYIFPAKDDSSETTTTFLKVKTDVMDLDSPVVEESGLLYDTFYAISETFNKWDTGMREVDKTLERSLRVDRPNIISADWKLHELQTLELKATGEYVDSSPQTVDDIFGTLSFLDEVWTNEDFYTPNSLINADLQTLREELDAVERVLPDLLKVNTPEVQVIKGPVYTSGEIHADFFIANTIVVDTIQDYRPPKDIFDNYVLKDKYTLIHSPLVFEDLTVTNLDTNYLDDLRVQDIAVKTQENIFRCQTTFNGSVTFKGKVEVTRVNGGILKDDIIFPNNISGCNFTDGFVVTNNTKTSGSYDFDNILLRSTPQKITATYHFDTLSLISNSFVGHIMGQNFSEFIDSVITTDYNGTITGKKDVKGTITADKLHIRKWNGLKFPDDFVSAHSDKVHLTGVKQFTTIEAKEVKIGHLLDEYEVDSIVTEAHPMEITGKWTFEGEATIDKDIDVRGLVDGVDLDDFKLKDSLDEKKDSYVINGDVEFESKVSFDSLHIKDRINDLDFTEAFEHLIVFKGSICEIPGNTTIRSNASIDSLTIEDGKINGIPIDSIMKTYGNQNITGSVTFTNDIRFNNLYALQKYNDIDLHEVALNGIHLNEIHNYDIKFAEVVCGKDKTLIVKGPVNEIPDYPSQVGLIAGRKSQEFTMPVTFQKLVLTDMNVKNSINLPETALIGGMNIDKWMQERVSLSEDENISQKLKVDGQIKISKDLRIYSLSGVEFSHLLKYSLNENSEKIQFSEFTKITNLSVLNGSVDFFDRLNGYELYTIKHDAIPMNYPTRLVLKGDWHFQSIIVDGPVRVQNEFCGIDLEHFSADAVRQNDDDVHFSGHQRFDNVKVLENFTTPVINDIPFEDFLMIDEVQNIHCHMKFYGDVEIDGDLNTGGHINNVSLSDLASYYSKNKHVHEVDGDLELDYVDTLTLKVDGYLNDQDIKDHISKLIKMDDVGLVFTGSKTFTGPVVIRNHINARFYNSIDLLETKILLLSDTIHLNQVYFSQEVVSELLHAIGGVEAYKIAYVNWEDMVNNSIPLLSGSSSPKPERLWLDKIRVPSIVNVGFFQGYRFDDFIPLNSNQTIHKLRIKEMRVSGRDLHVTGLVLGHDLYEEYHDTLMKESDYESYDLYGDKHFNGTVTIQGDISCFGPDFKSEVVDITNEFYLSSPVVFDQPLYVEGDVKVTEPVDGYTIEGIMSEALTQEDDQIITGKWDFQEGITFQENVNGDGDFEDFDIQQLIDSKNAEIKEVQERIGKAKQDYQELCYSVVNATQEYSYTPVKLDAFDSHQTILLQKQVERTITVTAHERLYLFTSSSTCEVVKYELKEDPELFYQSVESKETRPQLGQIQEWHSGNLEDVGILVFYSVASDCSDLTTGVYVTYITEQGQLSQVASLHNGSVLSFTVTSDEDNYRAAAIILVSPSHLKIVIWDHQGQLSPKTVEFELDESYASVLSVVQSDNTIRILLTSDHEFTLYDFHWISKSLTHVAGQNYKSFGKIQNIFESFGASYAVLQLSDSQLSSLKSPCTLQVFKVLEKSVSRYHQLSIQGLVSSTVFEFAHQPYLALLSKTHGLQIYRFMGLNGLQKMNLNPIKIFNGLEVNSFEYRPWHFSVSRPFITVLTANTLEVYHSVTYGDSMDVNYNSLCKVY